MADRPPAVGAEIETVGAASFETRVLEARGPIAVEFMSYGCSHCRALEPVLREVAAGLDGRERIARVNVAVDADLAATYGIRVTPTFVMFRDGGEVGRSEGPHPQVASLTTILTRPFVSGDGAAW